MPWRSRTEAAAARVSVDDPAALDTAAAAPQQGLWLRWEGVTYDVAAPPDAAVGTREPDGAAAAPLDAPPPGLKRILYGLSGQVLPGELLAVMGPSGSGKTSLLQVLAGRRSATAGAVLVNGKPMDVPTFRRASGFVAQSTVFLDTLTVRRATRGRSGCTRASSDFAGVSRPAARAHAPRRLMPRAQTVPCCVGDAFPARAGARDRCYHRAVATRPLRPSRRQAGARGGGAARRGPFQSGRRAHRQRPGRRHQRRRAAAPLHRRRRRAQASPAHPRCAALRHACCPVVHSAARYTRAVRPGLRPGAHSAA